jgi:hypothetical protein
VGNLITLIYLIIYNGTKLEQLRAYQKFVFPLFL